MARITFEGARYPWRDEEPALDALLRGGANVAFSCRKGTCHVCVLRATSGVVSEGGQRGLRDVLRARGYLLPCITRCEGDLTLERPDLTELYVRALVHEKSALSPEVTKLVLLPEVNLEWRAGQFVSLRRSDGVVRSYSVVTSPDDGAIELHVQRVAGGALSPWLCDELAVGDELELQGPSGACFYDEPMRGRPLVLIGAGTGLAPLVGIARDALARGHDAPIVLHHGARTHEGLYLHDTLASLRGIRYLAAVSGENPREGVARGRIADVAFADPAALADAVVFVCGRPAFVHEIRHRALLAGVAREDIHADSFEDAQPFIPDDAKKLAGIAPDPELWSAIGGDEGLRAILEAFYESVFADARLAPFFHAVTKIRAVDKQHEFLRWVFTGTGSYLGLNPFNAHHWMVISDELFDYREALFAECLRRYGVREDIARRWGALHEQFRRELVKARPRGLIRDGVEQPVEGFTDETMTVPTVCDGCAREMDLGAAGRMHVRTGALYCLACSARRIGSTERPPPG